MFNEQTGDFNNCRAVAEQFPDATIRYVQIAEDQSISEVNEHGEFIKKIEDSHHPDLFIDKNAVDSPSIKARYERSPGQNPHPPFCVALSIPDLAERGDIEHQEFDFYIAYEAQDEHGFTDFFLQSNQMQSHNALDDPEPEEDPRLHIYPNLPTRITDKRLEEGKERWEASSAPKPESPLLGVLIGDITEDEVSYELMPHIEKFIKETGGNVVITTSRRTSEEVCAKLAKESAYFKNIYFDNMKEKERGDLVPIMGLLAAADRLIATSDSMTMPSEIAATGKPAFIFPTEKAEPIPQTHAKLLQKYQLAHPIGNLMDTDLPTPTQPLNAAESMAKDILSAYQEKNQHHKPTASIEGACATLSGAVGPEPYSAAQTL